MSRKPQDKPVRSCPSGEGRNPPTPHQHSARQHPRITQFFHPTRPHLQSLSTPAQPCQEVAAALPPNNNPLISACNTAATIEQAPPPPPARPAPVIGQRISQLQFHPAPRTPNATHVPHRPTSYRPSQSARLVPDTGQPPTHDPTHYAHSYTFDAPQSQQTHISYSHKQSARLAPVIGPKNQRPLTAPLPDTHAPSPTSPAVNQHPQPARLVPVLGHTAPPARGPAHPKGPISQPNTPDPFQANPRAPTFPHWPHRPNTHRAPRRRNPSHDNTAQASPRNRSTTTAEGPEE
jgi:hypothetical protein